MISLKQFLRICIALWLLTMTPLLLLGPGYFVISMTFGFIILWFFPYWKPAYLVMAWVSGTKRPFNLDFPAQISIVRLITLLVKGVIIIYLLWVGANLLIKSNFVLNPIFD